MATKQKTPKQIAEQMKAIQLRQIDKHLRIIERQLEELEPLIDMRDRLRAQRRALLNERGTTGSGGKGLTQEEVVTKLRELESATVDELAKALSATPGAVRGHLNRGNGERFQVEDEGGIKKWSLREPEEEDNDDEEDDD